MLTLALAAGVRFYHLGTDDYWLDELHSFANSAAKRAEFEAFTYGEIFVEKEPTTALDQGSTVAAVWRGMRSDSHPPLYFLLLLYWRKLVGDGEFAARSLSAILSALSIIPIAVLLKRAGQPRAGLIAALVLALAFSSIFVAQQNRQYSLALLLLGYSYLALYEMHRASQASGEDSSALAKSTGARSAAAERGPKGVGPLPPSIANSIAPSPYGLPLVIAYAATLYLGMMTHYFCGLALAGHLLYAALYFRGRLLRDWLLAVAAAAALFAITWGPSLLAQLDFIRDQPWLSESGPGHLIKTVARLTDLPARLLISIEPFRYSWTRSLAGIGIGALIAIAVMRKREHAVARLLSGHLLRNSPAKSTQGISAAEERGLSEIDAVHLCEARPVPIAILFALWFAFPALGFLVLDLATDKQLLNHLRYPVIAVPGLAGLIGLAVGGWHLRVQPGGIVQLCSFLIVAAVMAFFLKLPATDNPQARAAVGVVESVAGPDDLLIFNAIDWPRDWVQQFYAPMRYYMKSGSNPRLLLREPPGDATTQAVSRFDRIIVISPLVGEIPNPALETHVLISRSPYFWQVGWVYVFERTAPSDQ